TELLELVDAAGELRDPPSVERDGAAEPFDLLVSCRQLPARLGDLVRAIGQLLLESREIRQQVDLAARRVLDLARPCGRVLRRARRDRPPARPLRPRARPVLRRERQARAHAPRTRLLACPALRRGRQARAPARPLRRRGYRARARVPPPRKRARPALPRAPQ